MLAKIAAVLVILISALTAPVIVSEIDATPTPTPAAYVGDAPIISTPDAAWQPGADCARIETRPHNGGTYSYCAAWATPTLPFSHGYPAP